MGSRFDISVICERKNQTNVVILVSDKIKFKENRFEWTYRTILKYKKNYSYLKNLVTEAKKKTL